MGDVAHFLVLGGERGHLPQCHGGCSRPGDGAGCPAYSGVWGIRRLLGYVEVERDYAILATLLDTGKRIGKLASMTRESVSAEGVLVSGKNGEKEGTYVAERV